MNEYIYTNLIAHIRTYMYMYINIYIYTNIYEYIYIYMYIYAPIYMYIYVFYIHTHLVALQSSGWEIPAQMRGNLGSMQARRRRVEQGRG